MSVMCKGLQIPAGSKGSEFVSIIQKLCVVQYNIINTDKIPDV